MTIVALVRKYKKTSAVLVLCSIGLCGAAWFLAAPIRGNLAARYDVHRGRYVVLGFGLPPEWMPEYTRLLRERYGIEYRAVAGCIVSRSLYSYVRAYDAVSSQAAKRKFGHDVFKDCAEDAERIWKTSAKSISAGI